MSLSCAAALVLLALVGATEPSAEEISKKAQEQGALNLLGLTAQLRLVTTSKDGKVKEQVLTSSSKKINGRTHSLSRFSQPSSVAGVALLTVEGEGSLPDELSLYLPRLRRVRKVAGNEKAKSFMDTDFSYSDLGGGDEKARKRLADANLDGRPAYVLETEGSEDSGYGRVKLFVDKATFVPLRAEYADKEGNPFKLYRTLKLKKFKERVLAAESTMENLKTGSKTLVEVQKLEEATLGDEAFSERALERG